MKTLHKTTTAIANLYTYCVKISICGMLRKLQMAQKLAEQPFENYNKKIKMSEQKVIIWR